MIEHMFCQNYDVYAKRIECFIFACLAITNTDRVNHIGLQQSLELKKSITEAKQSP